MKHFTEDDHLKVGYIKILPLINVQYPHVHEIVQEMGVADGGSAKSMVREYITTTGAITQTKAQQKTSTGERDNGSTWTSARSEERRVGKECGSTRRAALRWGHT